METNEYQTQLSTVNEWIKAADQKISILIAIVVGSVSLFGDHLAKLFLNMEPNIVILFVFSVWLTTLLWLVIKLIYALSPSIKNDKESVLYFGHIAKMNGKEFAKRLSKLSNKSYDNALIDQIYINSTIASRKHSLLAESVRILLASIVLLILLIILRLFA